MLPILRKKIFYFIKDNNFSNDLNIEQLIGNRRYLIPCLSIQIISYTKID